MNYLIDMKEFVFNRSEFGQWVKTERLEENFMTQIQLARRSGLSQQNIANIEKMKGITLETFEAVINALGYNIIIRKKDNA